LKLQFGQCNNERLTAVQSPASAAHSDQAQITRSSHRGRAPRGTDSIECPDFELFRGSNTWVQRNCILSCQTKWSKLSRPSFSPCGDV